MPPRAGEITASHSMCRSLSASWPQTSAAMSVYWSSNAHWKNCRLCKPDRSTKCPSRSAPVLRKSASRSSDMRALFADVDAELSAGWCLVRDGYALDLDPRAFRQCGDGYGRTRWRLSAEIGGINFI